MCVWGGGGLIGIKLVVKENFKALKTFDLPEKAKNIICTSSAFSWNAYKTSQDGGSLS